jgi:hypothetical protein
MTIFLAGDSSLDNKHWFFSNFSEKSEVVRSELKHDFIGPAVNGYENVLNPARSVKDVAYWMNRAAAERTKPGDVVTINCSVEESTIGERMSCNSNGGSGLLKHDEFIRDHVGLSGGDDIIVLSLGGNDVALRPTTRTIASVFALTRMPMILLRAFGRFSPGFSHLEYLFHNEIERIVQRMVPTSDLQKPPKLVVVCMIYFLDQQPGGSWADNVLRRLGYDADPTKLQYIIRALFERIEHKGFQVFSSAGDRVKVLPFPLFEVLDGSITSDYVQRVEPSVQGGRKLGNALLDFIFRHV